jgi:hypothetical protein
VDRRETPLRPVEVEQRLRSRLGFRAVLALSETALPSVLPSSGAIHVHVHPSILVAPDPVIDALSRFARAPGDLEARSLLLEFLDASPRNDRSEEHETCGAHHDLAAIFTEINARYFEGRVTARIAWSRGTAERRRHSILFGSYLRLPGETVGQIKIHPALDQEWVPRGFVEFVVHHECLHAVIPTRSIRGRRAFHPPEFRKRERLYPEFWHWRRWEKANLGRFLGKVPSTSLRTRPGGQPDQTVERGFFFGTE